MILRHVDVAATSSQDADKVDVLRRVIAWIERERDTSWLLEAHALGPLTGTVHMVLYRRTAWPGSAECTRQAN